MDDGDAIEVVAVDVHSAAQRRVKEDTVSGGPTPLVPHSMNGASLNNAALKPLILDRRTESLRPSGAPPPRRMP